MAETPKTAGSRAKFDRAPHGYTSKDKVLGVLLLLLLLVSIIMKWRLLSEST